MLKTKFIDIVKTFSPDELKGFRSFVHSPFHNTNKNVIKITDMISKFYPELNDVKMDKQNIFKKIYPGKKYNDTVMRIIMSDLLKLAEEYLSYLNFTADHVNEKKHLLRELSERNLSSLFNHHLKISENNLYNNEKINMYYFINLFELKSQKIDNMISSGKHPESSEDVFKQGEYLICFFLVNILNVAHEQAIQHDVLNINFNFNPVEEFLKQFDLEKFLGAAEKNNYEYYEILSVYYYMYLSIIHPGNEDYFFKLKNLVFKNLQRFSRDEIFNLFIILESICSTGTAAGNKNFFAYLMEIYKQMLSNNVFIHKANDYFQLNLFRNIFYTALVLNEAVWAKNFVDRHINELHPEYREDTSHLAFAFINYHNKDFTKSLDELSLVKLNYFVFKFDVRILSLKIYYEMNSMEQALSLIDSFSHFLTNNKSLEYYRESFGNFLKIVKQLIRIKAGDNKKEAEELIREINNFKKLFSKDWLLEKAREL